MHTLHRLAISPLTATIFFLCVCFSLFLNLSEIHQFHINIALNIEIKMHFQIIILVIITLTIKSKSKQMQFLQQNRLRFFFFNCVCFCALFFFFSQWLAFRNSIVATNKQTSNGFCLFHFVFTLLKVLSTFASICTQTTIYLDKFTIFASDTHIFWMYSMYFQQFINQNSNEVSEFYTFCTINTMFQWRLLYSGTVGI